MVAVAAALDRLEVVPLGGADVAEARPAAHHVDDDAGDLTARHVGKGFLHERDAATRRGGHGRDAAGARPQQHSAGGKLALGLHELPAVFRQQAAHGFGYLVLRGDGIAEITAAAGVQRAVSHGLVALDEDASVVHAGLPPLLSRNTRMAVSGHMRAQEAHPVQRPSVSITS